MSQEKNTPEKNFSPREEDERLRELSLKCIEDVLQAPYHCSKIFLLELLKIFRDLTTEKNSYEPFDKFFYDFGQKAAADISEKESFFCYCLFSPISRFVFETLDFIEAKERFSKLSTSICSLIKSRIDKQEDNFLLLYRLFLIESTLTGISVKNLLQEYTYPNLYLLFNLLSNKNQSIEYTFNDIDSWLDLTRLP